MIVILMRLNAVGVLRFLRELQRRHGVALLVVHHARKGAGNARAGQALRGSSEFHAWGDSNLYLRRDGDDLMLTVEHRAAPSLAPVAIALAHRRRTCRQRRRHALRRAAQPLPRPRRAPLYERLAALTDAGRVVKTDQGYRLAGN